jgi:hypothetical protein
MTLDLEAAKQRAIQAGKLTNLPSPPAQINGHNKPADAYKEYQDTIPDISNPKTDFSKKVDEIIDRLDIIAFYKMFCGKMTPEIGKRRESIMISCPKPNHPDKNPSAWISLDKQTWFCAGCNEGGDGYDIAAYNLGFPVPGYKTGRSFHELREAIVGKLGYTTITPLGMKGPILVPPAGGEPEKHFIKPRETRTLATAAKIPPAPPAPPSIDAFLKPSTPVITPPPAKAAPPIDPAPVPSVAPAPPVPDASPTPAPGPATVVEPPTPLKTDKALEEDEDDDDIDRDFRYPHLDWRKIVPADTFLYKYLEITAADDIPEEYNFWNGMAAIGLALGRDTVLHDRKPVLGNLYICTIGASGSGKSQAVGHFNNLIRAALPFKFDDPSTRGVRIIPTPGSGEQMISSFTRMLVVDPTKPKELYPFPVKGYVEFPEFADLMSRSARMGSTLSQTLMHFYDARDYISTASRTGGDFEAIDSYCAVLTTTQLKSIRTLMRSRDAASGFLNRWVFSMGPAKKRHLFDGTKIDITPAIEPLQRIVAWSASVPEVKLSADANKELGDWWYAIAEKYKLTDSTDMLSRLDLLIKKLVLLFAGNSHESIVSVDTIKMVKDVFPYLINTFNAVSARVGNTEEDEMVNAILHAISGHEKKYKDPPTLREIGLRISKKKFSKQQIKKVIETLVALEHIEVMPSPPGRVGRPTVRYHVVA